MKLQATHLILLLCAPLVAASSEDVAIRMHTAVGAKGSACSTTELARVRSWVLDQPGEKAPEHNAWWCSFYCEGFADGSCWVAHRSCKSEQNYASTVDQREDVGVLSEVEMLVPDINESSLSGFSDGMRSTCVKGRTSILGSIKQALEKSPEGELTPKCKRSISSRIRVACVKVPDEPTVPQYQASTY